MKRIFTMLLALGMMAAVVGCSASQEEQQNQNNVSAQEDTQTEETNTEETDTAEGKTLVAYYSATGNTKAVAEMIAEALGADTFEITPAEPYTSEDLNWTDDSSRVSQEYSDPSLRTVELTADTVENWESYDTVFIGYPIWWGIAAWPVDGFVSANDFTGKTVIPFCTSSSSGLGESGQLLEELAGSGDWQEGQRFRSGADEADVSKWLEDIGMKE
jgi:uncharacterized protein YxeA